jgi:maltooligosyltrehalose trehalohydrolase
MKFELWAPRVSTVVLVVDSREIDMTSGQAGWWSADVDVGGSVRYGFRLDGDEKVLPDPRSRRQPDGVHRLSATFDPSEYNWHDEFWTGRQLAGGLVYELHIGTFTPEGTFDAAIGKLDHLVSLGVDFVELLPVNGFNGEHNWGYDGVLWYTVHEPYGGPAG